MTPGPRDSLTVYPIYPARSAKTFVLALLVVSGFLSLIAVPVGWWLADWTGALAGISLCVAIFLLADGTTIRELRTFPDGEIEFRSLWRRTRVDMSRIVEVTGFLDRDEGDRSYNLSIANRWRPIGVDDFAGLPAFIDEVRGHNPALRLSGEWPHALLPSDRSPGPQPGRAPGRSRRDRL